MSFLSPNLSCYITGEQNNNGKLKTLLSFVPLAAQVDRPGYLMFVP